MKIIKILWFSTADAPEGKAIKVLQEKSGFYYLSALAQHEGFQTPFASIEEIGAFLEKDITLVREVV